MALDTGIFAKVETILHTTILLFGYTEFICKIIISETTPQSLFIKLKLYFT